MLRHSVVQSRLLAEVSVVTKSLVAPLSLSASRLAKSKLKGAMKTHAHITHSKIGSSMIQKPIVPPELIKLGDPVSSSVLFGDMTKAREFQFNTESLNARGFLRYQKPYNPPANATDKVLEICRSCLNISGDVQALLGTQLDDSKVKYEILAKTFERFQHGVPNSMLHMMTKVGDVVDFYCTRVNTQTPYEELIRNPNLPPNLHVQKEPLRYSPENDKQFGDHPAHTKSSTIVTGLRTKKKYPGHEAKMTWP